MSDGKKPSDDDFRKLYVQLAELLTRYPSARREIESMIDVSLDVAELLLEDGTTGLGLIH